uniref:Uncharacterized protein n=1 Tax=Myripristis murdjan TaxID=586833 RepID=A0A667WBL2_9TELE
MRGASGAFDLKQTLTTHRRTLACCAVLTQHLTEQQLLSHVITPLRLIKVGHRPLLAEVRGHSSPLCALRHSRLGSLGCHANSFAICLAVCLCAIRPFHLQISFSAFHAISKHASCMRPYRKASTGRK